MHAVLNLPAVQDQVIPPPPLFLCLCVCVCVCVCKGGSTGIVYTKHNNSYLCLWNYCQFPVHFQELCGLGSVTHDIHLRHPTTGWISHAGQLTWFYNMALLSLMCLVLVLLQKQCFSCFHFCRFYAVVLCLDVPWPDSSSIRICVAVIPVSPVSCASICLKCFHFCRLHAIVLCSHVVLWPGSSSVRSCVAVMPASPVFCDSIWLHQPDQT